MTAVQPSQAIRNADGFAPPIAPTQRSSTASRGSRHSIAEQTTRVVSGVPARWAGNVTEAGVKIASEEARDPLQRQSRRVGSNAASVGALRVAAQCLRRRVDGDRDDAAGCGGHGLIRAAVVRDRATELAESATTPT